MVVVPPPPPPFLLSLAASKLSEFPDFGVIFHSILGMSFGEFRVTAASGTLQPFGCGGRASEGKSCHMLLPLPLFEKIMYHLYRRA
jgi:hypothetical protein